MRAQTVLMCLVAAAGIAGCGSDPTGPKVHALSGHVRLTGYLVASDGEHAGTRIVEDADGVAVELVFGTRVVATTTTVDGNYRFTGLQSGGYVARVDVIGGIGDVTDLLTVANQDVVANDTLSVKSTGDLNPTPNPVTDRTDIFFDTVGGDVVVDVIDLAGKPVRHVHSGTLPPGYFSVTWLAVDQQGHPAGAPMYWVTFQSGTDFRAHLLFR